MKLITQRREGAKLVDLLALRLCVRLFPSTLCTCGFFEVLLLVAFTENFGINANIDSLAFIRVH